MHSDSEMIIEREHIDNFHSLGFSIKFSLHVRLQNLFLLYFSICHFTVISSYTDILFTWILSSLQFLCFIFKQGKFVCGKIFLIYEYIDTFGQKKWKKSEVHKAKKKKHNNIYIPQNNVWQPNSNIRKRWMSNARYVHSKSTKERYI